MNRNVIRLIVAFILCITCYAGNELWFRSGKRDTHSGDGKPSIARISRAANEVQRKEVKRVIWESVARNDELYAGEAIRTTDNAEAEILLVKSGATLHLDPDSLVVLEENANGLALDFLQGNLFVQSERGDAEAGSDHAQGSGGAASNITLKTGTGEIKLSSADMSVSRDRNGQVNLEVFKGQAELRQGTKKLALGKDSAAVLTDKGVSENKDRLKLLSPAAGETILLNLARAEPLAVSFKPLSADYRVTAELGATRASLSKVPDLTVGAETGQLKLPAKAGKWYLRLTAQSQDKAKPQLVTMVTPFLVEPKAAPSLIEPVADHPCIKTQPDEEVEFRWLPRNHYSQQLIEISQDPTFKKPLASHSLDGKVSTFKTALKDGAYYWRVVGYLPIKGKHEGLASPSSHFEVFSHVEIQPPKLTSPANKAHIPIFEAQKDGVSLKWSAPRGVERFNVVAQIKDGAEWKNLYAGETETTAIKLNDLKPGEYRWKVTSLEREKNTGPATEMIEFTVDDIPKLEWSEPEGEVTYEFTTPTPSLAARWKALPSGVALYRFRIGPEGEPLDNANWSTTKLTSFDTSVTVEGRYTGIVEALNNKNQTIAQSAPKTFIVKRHPLLPAPKWAAGAPEVLRTDHKGDLSFSWLQVDGAREYLMVLQNDAGQVIDQKTVSRTTASVNKLKPGQYRVKLRAVDGFKRPGEEGTAKTLEVPTTSDIKAPKIKAMTVK